MSSATAALWADGGKVIRDTVDTCVIERKKDGVYYLYAIDKRRGVITGFYKQSIAEQIYEQFFYGCSDGIYYPRKLSNSPTDTTIHMGGYRFYDIRINGKPVDPAACFPAAPAPPPRRTCLHADASGRAKLTVAGSGAALVALYDLSGRDVFSARFTPGTHILTLGRMCRNVACPGGRFLLRVKQDGREPYSAIVNR